MDGIPEVEHGVVGEEWEGHVVPQRWNKDDRNSSTFSIEQSSVYQDLCEGTKKESCFREKNKLFFLNVYLFHLN
jgi:hypothetical protein